MSNSFTFGAKPTRLTNIFSIILIGIIWVFVAFIFAYVALLSIRDNNYSIVLISIALMICLTLFFWKNYVSLNSFFPVEISGKFVVFLRPNANRKVYDMAEIYDLRLIWHFLFFRYNGWPILIPLSIDKEERIELVSLIELANKKRNEMDGSFEPPIR